MSYTAYVPCYNNKESIETALLSLYNQTLAPSEIFLVDDCSTDGSHLVAKRIGIPVISNSYNRGRGYVRALAVETANCDFIVSCDATNYLPSDFVEQALPWFDDVNVAAVFGRIWQDRSRTVADRWRARHLFKMDESMSVDHSAQLITYGCILRRSAVLQTGNFNPALIHSEDSELGIRLLTAGYSVIYDPKLHVFPSCSNSVLEVLERYWRWYAGKDETISITSYLRGIVYSLKVLAFRDLLSGDLASIGLSILCPHYQFWRSWSRRRH